MGIKGLCRFFCHRLVEAVVVILLILFLPNLPPYASISEPFSVPSVQPLEGKLALNEKLNNVEVWHKGDLIGPEAIIDYNGELYVSVSGGDIVKLTNNHITPIVKTGKPCKGLHEERICGRPLGLQFDKNGMLYVADAYYGIFKVDVKTGEKTLIISVDQKIGNKKPKLPNSIAVASNGDIFWSDSSTQFHLDDGIFDLLSDPSGRLIHYDSKTKENKVLIDKIHFANGVILSDDEEFVLVAETFRNRIHRYYLKGPKKGTHDIFVDGLPGLPDNLKSDGKGGFLVPLVVAVDAENPSLTQVIGPFPLIRKFIARVFGLFEMGFGLVNKVYPCEFAQKGIHFIGHFTSSGQLFIPKRVTVLHMDKSGKILDSLHSLNKKISNICDAHIFKDNLYLGSPFNDYIARVPLSKVGLEHLTPDRKKRDVPVEQPKVKPIQTATTTQRPTTTPPPPTTTTPKQQTPPPQPKQQTPPPPKPQTTPPAQKQSSPPKQQTPPQPTKQETIPPPPKQQATTPPKPQTPPPTPTQQTPPVSKQQNPPPSKQQTHPTPKPQTSPTPKQPKPKQQATNPPKQQTPPPSKQQASRTPPSQQQTPPPKQQASTSPEQQMTSPPVKQQTPPPKQQTQAQNQAAPPAQTPPSKQSAPSIAQPVRDQTRSVPINN